MQKSWHFDSIHIQSSLSFEELAQHFRSADLVFIPRITRSRSDSFGVTGSGTPVATVNQEPLTEMVDDQ